MEFYNNIYSTLLHIAVNSTIVEMVKFIVSLKVININAQDDIYIDI